MGSVQIARQCNTLCTSGLWMTSCLHIVAVHRRREWGEYADGDSPVGSTRAKSDIVGCFVDSLYWKPRRYLRADAFCQRLVAFVQAAGGAARNQEAPACSRESWRCLPFSALVARTTYVVIWDYERRSLACLNRSPAACSRARQLDDVLPATESHADRRWRVVNPLFCHIILYASVKHVIVCVWHAKIKSNLLTYLRGCEVVNVFLFNLRLMIIARQLFAFFFFLFSTF